MNALVKSSLFLLIVCGSSIAFLLPCNDAVGGRRGQASGNSIMAAGPSSGSQLWGRTRTDPYSGLGAEESDAPQSVSAATEQTTGRKASFATTTESSRATDKDEDEEDDDDELLSCAIDSLLRGDYPFEYAEDAPAPHPGLEPGAVVGSVLRSLRKLDDPHPSHGAAVLWRFCLPLTRSERWGGASGGGAGGGTSWSRNRSNDRWKDLHRPSLTPALLARQLRASSEFSCLLDWKHLDVTEGAYGLQRDLVGAPSVAFVNAALYFEEGMEPVLIQFTLRRIGGVWLLDSARRSPKELFADR